MIIRMTLIIQIPLLIIMQSKLFSLSFFSKQKIHLTSFPLQNLLFHYYLSDRLDEDDKIKRESERTRRRKERWNKRSKKSFDPLNPYRIEKKDVALCSRVILNDDMEFLSAERNDDIYASSKCRNNIFDFGESQHHRAVGKHNTNRSSSRNRRRR